MRRIPERRVRKVRDGEFVLDSTFIFFTNLRFIVPSDIYIFDSLCRLHERVKRVRGREIFVHEFALFPFTN